MAHQLTRLVIMLCECCFYHVALLNMLHTFFHLSHAATNSANPSLWLKYGGWIHHTMVYFETSCMSFKSGFPMDCHISQLPVDRAQEPTRFVISLLKTFPVDSFWPSLKQTTPDFSPFQKQSFQSFKNSLSKGSKSSKRYVLTFIASSSIFHFRSAVYCSLIPYL